MRQQKYFCCFFILRCHRHRRRWMSMSSRILFLSRVDDKLFVLFPRHCPSLPPTAYVNKNCENFHSGQFTNKLIAVSLPLVWTFRRKLLWWTIERNVLYTMNSRKDGVIAVHTNFGRRAVVESFHWSVCGAIDITRKWDQVQYDWMWNE